MRPRHPLRPIATAFVALLFVGACAGEGTAPETVASLSVSPSSATLASRAPLPLSATPRTTSGKTLSGRPVTWSSSDPATAAVSGSGLVTAGAVLGGAPGLVTISATSEGVVGHADLTVLPVPVATVYASPATTTLPVGGTQQLTSTFMDAGGVVLTGRTVIWSSSDTNVATVSQTGLVTATAYVGGGTRTATITATSEGRGGAANIQVTPLPVATLSIAADSVAVGDTRLLTAELHAASGASLTGRTVVWSSSDTTVATIMAGGLLVPVQRVDGIRRTTTVTATAEGVSGSAVVTVLPAPVGTITIEPGSGVFASGAIDTLVATPRTLSGVVLAGRTVTWQSSNPAVLAVNAAGVVTAGLVTGPSPVEVTITATADGFSADVLFSVAPLAVANVQVTPDSVTIFPRQTTQLQATVTSSGGTALTGRTVTWSTSDASVVTVSATGLVTAPIYVGTDTRTALVIATSEGRTDTTRLVVEPTRVVTVVATPSTLLMPSGSSQRVSTILRDALGDPLNDRAVTWSTSDAAVATVNDSGVVSIVGPGTATITATADGVSGSVAVSRLVQPLIPSTLVAGGYHHCALTAGGEAYCWGWNGYGQLGNASSSDSPTPVPVAGGHVFTSLSGGSLHTCGITNTGASYCWGWNANGQLGDGTHNPRTQPTLVQSPVAFVSMAAGFYHTCALTAAGAAWCWGRNNAAQLGDGTLTDRDIPAPVIGGIVFASVVGKYAHTCGLDLSGAAYCWGRNFHGAIGDSTIVEKDHPVPMRGGRTFTQIVMGWDHTCGLESNGNAYCLGRNQYGQLGNGRNTGEELGFVRVIGVPALRDLQSGYYHMCATAPDDSAWCWGRNHVGEVGDGTTIDRGTPLNVRVGDDFTRVGGGYGHACASTVTGVIQCWGTLLGGVLGDAAPAMRTAPSGPTADHVAARPGDRRWESMGGSAIRLRLR